MTDLLLVFPPQWSPFQPALSLPSLSAWLKRAGFQVESLDLNVLFYEWLLSDECAAILIRHVRNADLSEEAKEAYVATFSNVASFRADVDRLREPGTADETPAEYASRNYLAIKAFETYLDAVSNIAESFTISPYEFRLAAGNLDASELEQRVSRPPELLEEFLRSAAAKHILPREPKMIGLSCIGQEQLYFTLLLGSILKRATNAPVIVGGTIFSRIFERGALRPDWFDTYFDVIVRNEGEKPAERLLSNLTTGRRLTQDVPGVVYRERDRIVSSQPCPPLSVPELPVPDFDDLPLGRYVSSEITLPLLSARGCYWGKCEFCHHGMVYGEKYAPYKAKDVLEAVTSLSARYNVRHFAFNDEALPPTTARAMARMFPPHEETGWTFTGLIKFEPSYSPEDFAGLHEIGFRSLYVGLESASERVLDLMRKRSKRETIVANLTDATRAGIWMHCFLFFGFPGETEEDAQQTYDFIVDNPDIVSSFGAGTFSLEHNAPIFHHYNDFGIELKIVSKNDVDVYYDYDVNQGISADRALQWQERLVEATRGIPNYIAAKWVPRELLLCMLSIMAPPELLRVGLTMRECGGFPGTTRLRDIATRVSVGGRPDTSMVINRANGRVIVLHGAAAALFDLCYEYDIDVGHLHDTAPMLFEKLAFVQDLQPVMT
jgi:anaerobic magnesium-protoporphyrin IX monomethyl ester cyclase